MVLLRTPEGDFAFGYGANELGGTNSPRADTHFRAASITKTMTAAVIVLLVQEGKLCFDDPVSKYVEGVPNGDNITISDLLKMRSGLYNYTSAPELGESLDHDPTSVWTPQELLAIAFTRPTIFAGAPRGAQDVPHWWEGVWRLLTEINLPSHYHFRSKQDRP
jgi:D-alanyl-D-alanine carboxypeptidase